MTVEAVREILKVHVSAAEQSGKFMAALAMLEVLDVIDFEISLENKALTN